MKSFQQDTREFEAHRTYYQPVCEGGEKALGNKLRPNGFSHH